MDKRQLKCLIWMGFSRAFDIVHHHFVIVNNLCRHIEHN